MKRNTFFKILLINLFFFHKVELAYVNIILITHTHCDNKKRNDVRVVKKEHCENKICLKFIMNYRKQHCIQSFIKVVYYKCF